MASWYIKTKLHYADLIAKLSCGNLPERVVSWRLLSPSQQAFEHFTTYIVHFTTFYINVLLFYFDSAGGNLHKKRKLLVSAMTAGEMTWQQISYL